MKRESHIKDSEHDTRRQCEPCGEVIDWMKGEKAGAWKIRKREFKRQHKRCKPV